MIFSLLAIACFLFIALSCTRGASRPRRSRLPTSAREWTDNRDKNNSTVHSSRCSFRLRRAWSSIVVVVSTIVITRLLLASVLPAAASMIVHASAEIRGAYVFVADIVGLWPQSRSGKWTSPSSSRSRWRTDSETGPRAPTPRSVVWDPGAATAIGDPDRDPGSRSGIGIGSEAFRTDRHEPSDPRRSRRGLSRPFRNSL